MEWQPIESAPFMQKVLLYTPDSHPQKRICVGYLGVHKQRNGVTRKGWHIINTCIFTANPTHWMPLPKPPIKTEE